MSILNVEHLSHGFGDRAIFTDVSFRLLKGEHIGLIGANGEGKSTFMNIVTGKLMPDEGKVEWAKNVRAGYLDQHAVLEKGMTIRDVLKSAYDPLLQKEQRMNEICDIASRYGIPVVEDAAEAMGAVYDGRYCGTFGQYGIFSFNGNKMITTSGGGALLCHTEEEAQRVKFYATQAREPFPWYQHEQIGYNYRLSNVSAGIGRGQMRVVDNHIAHRRAIHRLYTELLAGLPGITVVEPKKSTIFLPNYWLTTIKVDSNETSFSALQLMQHLAKADIETRPLWKPLHLQPVFSSSPTYVNGVSEALFNCGLCLPSGSMMTCEDVMRVADTIRSMR